MKTTLDYFYEHEVNKKNEVFLRQPKGDQWITYTWGEVGQQARKMAAAIKAMNLKPKTHIGILSKNCAHWIIADVAIMMSGHISVPFYATLSARSLNQVLNLSDTKVLFVGKLDNWQGQKGGVPASVHCISFPHYEGNSKVDNMEKWEDLMAKHEPLQNTAHPKPSDLFTIIYTSGTTGTPKGVILTYGNIGSLMEAEQKHNFIKLFEQPDNRHFSYLPLNHIAERNIVEGAAIFSGGTISFAESLATFAKNLADTQPTIFMAVPRIWTKFKMGVLAKMPASRLNLLLKIPIVNNIVRKKILTGLGLNSARVALTGAAPMPVSLIQWFQKLGLTIQEVYGMTENCGGCTLMPADNIKNGTVGRVIPECQVKIDPKTEEVLMKADWVMQGYYKSPKKTAEVLQDGWLHTGDQGKLDKDNYLSLTGRVKDTFKTTKGEYIIPGPIEWKFAKNNFIEQICVAGLGAPQPVAMINLSEQGLAADKEEVTAALQATLDEVNATLPNYQKVRTLVIMKESWDVENGCLTPTLKIKRNVLDQRFKNEYTPWFEDKRSIIWQE